MWRNGVHVVDTSIWCDARRARDVCFVSAADAIPAARHGQLIATRETLALLSRRDEPLRPGSDLSVPYDRPFTLGTVRLELVRSGRAIGTASLLVQTEAARILYAGRIDPRGGGLGGTADLRRCDVLVVAAVHGQPGSTLPAADEVAAEALDWAGRITAGGGVAAILVPGPLDGLEVAASARAEGLRVTAHRSIHHAARKLAAIGADVPAMTRCGRSPRAGTVLLWPAARRERLEALAMPPGSATALASGAALEPDATARLGVDTAFPWSHDADFESLREYVDGSGASQVYFTHRHAESAAAALDRPGRPARVLGPPLQMSLF